MPESITKEDKCVEQDAIRKMLVSLQESLASQRATLGRMTELAEGVRSGTKLAKAVKIRVFYLQKKVELLEQEIKGTQAILDSD